MGVSLFNTPSKKPSMIVILDQPTQEVNATSLRHLIGKMVYVGFPYPRLAIVSSIADINMSVYSDATENNSHKDKDDFFLEAEYHQNILLKRYGLDIGEVRALLYVKLFSGMKKELNGSITQVFHENEFAYPQQLLVTDYIPIADPKFTERGPAPIQDEFPQGRPVLYLSENYFGFNGVVDTTFPKTNSLQVSLQVPHLSLDNYKLPTQLKAYSSQKYYSLKMVGHKIGLSPKSVGLIIGRCQIFMSDGKKKDIGLNFRNVKDNKRVVGFARAAQNEQTLDETYFLNFGDHRDRPSANKFSIAAHATWELSDKAIGVIMQYMQAFPELFKCIEGSAFDFTSEAIFPVDSEKRFTDLDIFLESLPHFNLPFLPCDADIVPIEVLKEIEATLIQSSNSKNATPQVASITVPSPMLLYRPPDPFPKQKRADFDMGHFVVNMSASGHVPFGLRGIVVGIEGLNAHVVFEDEFLGGNNLHDRLATKRGQTVPVESLLNLSVAKPRLLKNVPSSHQNNVANRNTYSQHYYSTNNNNELPDAVIQSIKKAPHEMPAEQPKLPFVDFNDKQRNKQDKKKNDQNDRVQDKFAALSLSAKDSEQQVEVVKQLGKPKHSEMEMLRAQAMQLLKKGQDSVSTKTDTSDDNPAFMFAQKYTKDKNDKKKGVPPASTKQPVAKAAPVATSNTLLQPSAMQAAPVQTTTTTTTTPAPKPATVKPKFVPAVVQKAKKPASQ